MPRKNSGVFHSLGEDNVISMPPNDISFNPTTTTAPKAGPTWCDKRTTRQTIHGRTNALYDIKYHPMDDFVRPKGAASHRKRTGIEMSIFIDDTDEEDDNDDGGMSDFGSAAHDPVEDEDERIPPAKKRIIEGTRHSTRPSSQTFINYNMQHHPQDEILRKIDKDIIPKRTLSRKLKRVSKPAIILGSNNKSSSTEIIVHPHMRSSQYYERPPDGNIPSDGAIPNSVQSFANAMSDSFQPLSPMAEDDYRIQDEPERDFSSEMAFKDDRFPKVSDTMSNSVIVSSDGPQYDTLISEKQTCYSRESCERTYPSQNLYSGSDEDHETAHPNSSLAQSMGHNNEHPSSQVNKIMKPRERAKPNSPTREKILTDYMFSSDVTFSSQNSAGQPSKIFRQDRLERRKNSRKSKKLQPTITIHADPEIALESQPYHTMSRTHSAGYEEGKENYDLDNESIVTPQMAIRETVVSNGFIREDHNSELHRSHSSEMTASTFGSTMPYTIVQPFATTSAVEIAVASSPDSTAFENHLFRFSPPLRPRTQITSLLHLSAIHLPSPTLTRSVSSLGEFRRSSLGTRIPVPFSGVRVIDDPIDFSVGYFSSIRSAPIGEENAISSRQAIENNVVGISETEHTSTIANGKVIIECTTKDTTCLNVLDAHHNEIIIMELIEQSEEPLSMDSMTRTKVNRVVSPDNNLVSTSCQTEILDHLQSTTPKSSSACSKDLIDKKYLPQTLPNAKSAFASPLELDVMHQDTLTEIEQHSSQQADGAVIFRLHSNPDQHFNEAMTGHQCV